MKKKKAVHSKARVKKPLIPKAWLRGKIDRGTIFIVVIVVTLMFCGYIFVGGTIPETIPKPRAENIMSIIQPSSYPTETGLQMHTFQGVTITPYPTQQSAAPAPQGTTVTEVDCGRSVTGVVKPELIWAYRIAATAASNNAQSIQVFYSGADAIPVGTTAMTQSPTQSLANPPVNANNRDANGIPVSPVIFLTDITANAGDNSGDAQAGGTPQFPNNLYGSWRTETGLSPIIQNGQNLGPGADLWPAANGPAGGARASDSTAQLVWNLGNMRTKTGAAIIPGNKYRAQIVLHEGSRNQEIAQLCTQFTAPGGAQNPPPANPPAGGGNSTVTCAGSANTPTAPVTGYRLTKCEDFTSGLGAFSGYNGGGGSTVVGRGRVASQCTAVNGILTLTQNADGATCGGTMSSFNQRFGYWEVKMRTFTTGTAGGSAPHPVLILWPDTDVWDDGELDYFESDIGDAGMGVFLHCVGNARNNCYHTTKPMDIAQWHVYGFEWTAAGFKGFVDGQLVYETDGAGSNPKVSMHQTIQLDNLTGNTPVKPGKMEVDWVHMYAK